MISLKKKAIIILALVIFIFGYVLIRNQPWLSNINAAVLVKNYTQSEIDHFTSFAFYEGCIIKWKTNIRICIINSGPPDYLLHSKVIACIQELNKIMDEIKITVVPEDQSNTQFYFVDTIESEKTGTTIIGANQIKIPYPTLSIGEIKVRYDKQDLDEINSTILHEFTHLLGFHHHQIGYQSTFNSNQKKLVGQPHDKKWIPSFDTYPDLDKAAIRIMYDADVAIDPGMTKEKFFRKIEEARKELKNDGMEISQ